MRDSGFTCCCPFGGPSGETHDTTQLTGLSLLEQNSDSNKQTCGLPGASSPGITTQQYLRHVAFSIYFRRKWAISIPKGKKKKRVCEKWAKQAITVAEKEQEEAYIY